MLAASAPCLHCVWMAAAPHRSLYLILCVVGGGGVDSERTERIGDRAELLMRDSCNFAACSLANRCIESSIYSVESDCNRVIGVVD